MPLTEIRAAGHIPGAAIPASLVGLSCRQRQPAVSVRSPDPVVRVLHHAVLVNARHDICSPVKSPVGIAAEVSRPIPSPRLRLAKGAGAVPTASKAAPIGANQAENFIAAGDGGSRELDGVRADLEPFDPLNPPPFLPGKLKDAVDADPGDAGFPLGQPALLGGDKTAENAAFPGIDGIVPFIAVFPGFPSLGLGKGVGLVDAAVKGLAPVFGQGFEDGDSAVLVGKGLPIGTVPGDAPGLGW